MNLRCLLPSVTYRGKYRRREGLEFHIEIALAKPLLPSTLTGRGRFHRGTILQDALHVEHLRGGGPQPLGRTGPRHGQRRLAGAHVHGHLCTALTLSFTHLYIYRYNECQRTLSQKLLCSEHV